MKRAIVTPADLAGAALDELKQWLAITSTAEDAALIALLGAAGEMCEAFTGTMPLETECEELLAGSTEWQALSARPVQAISGIEAVPAEGARYPLAADAYAIELEADGSGRVRLVRQGNAGRVAVRFTAGLAPDWASLRAGLRQGIVRLAAYAYRERGEGGASAPPAAVTALWRPWRRMRLA
ncbi:MAG: head-tail connector protein [Tsuneonella sp.]